MLSGHFCSFDDSFVKSIIQTGIRHAVFREILLKFDLRVHGKVPSLISLKG